jgi:hypothetical protein
LNNLQSLDANWGYYVTQYSPYTYPATSTMYQGGPVMPYGEDPALDAWTGQINGQVYFEGYGGAVP